MDKRKIVIILILMLIVAGAASFYFFRSRGDDNNNQAEMKRNQDYEAEKKAILEKDIGNCLKVDPKIIDECIYRVAKGNNDVAVCDKIAKDDMKAECRESVAYEGIIKGEDIKKCSGLKIERIYSQCLMGFFWKWDDLEKCSGIEGKDRENCRDVINKKSAYQDNDESKCGDVINKELKDDCFAVLKSKPKDSDSDGLLDSDEISYGINPYLADTDKDGLGDLDELKTYFTNPKIADTDNDGFSDGDEVKNGYNPKGDGNL